MILFQSPLTMAMLLTALVLAIIGAGLKKGHVLSFFAGLACALAVLCGLLHGASQQEALLYVLGTLLAFALSDRWGRRRDG